MTGNPDSKWGHKLEVLAGKDTLCSEDLRLQVKGLFGGMGSLNDIVLFHSDGTVDRNGSTEFDMLCSQLYELLRSSA
ncbi:DUF6966 domain-containing protein [Thalassospira tepidiphila]|nr:hypothetical protein MACH01_21630 [Thalassospira tepidiphila]